MLTVNESGLYCLIFRSRKPQARLFRKWVTAEVLPAIRKSGQYLVRPRQPAAIAGLFDPPPILAAGSDIEHLAKLITAALGDKSRRVLRWSEVHALIQQGNLFQWVLLRLEACGTPPPFWRERACFSRYLMRYWGYAVPIGTGTCRFVPHGNGRHRVYCFERVEGGVA